MTMGKLIVLEGTDGSGKSTQMQLLMERLEREGRSFRKLRFPQYDQPSSALIRMYLGGEFGQDPNAVNAYAASTFYAVDRYASFVRDWGEDYRRGELLISDRYTTSNAVHQAGKVPPEERKAFLTWLTDLEYNKMGLPKPDLVLWLDMPVEKTLELMQHRQACGGAAADIHEKDCGYLAHCHEMAREAADFYGWCAVECVRGDKIRPAEEIAEEIYERILRCMEG